MLYESLYESIHTFNVCLKAAAIVYSNEDRLLKFPSKLQNIRSCSVYRINGGHTSFLEREMAIIWIMRNLTRLGGLMVIPIICITGMCVCQLLTWP